MIGAAASQTRSLLDEYCMPVDSLPACPPVDLSRSRQKEQQDENEQRGD
jgi:hypothetical protein